jgi:hypothetical protein
MILATLSFYLAGSTNTTQATAAEEMPGFSGKSVPTAKQEDINLEEDKPKTFAEALAELRAKKKNKQKNNKHKKKGDSWSSCLVL